MAGIIIAGVVGAAFGFIMAVLCVSAGSHYEEYEVRDDEEQEDKTRRV